MVRRGSGVRGRPRGGLPMTKAERRAVYSDKAPVGKMQCYRRRSRNLSELGYASYQEYLASAAWRDIRAKKLRWHPDCVLCDQRATQVHHLSYACDVLLGLKNALLVTMCDKCHVLVEFDGNQKRTLEQANEFLIDKARERGKINWLRMVKRVMRYYRNKKGEMK